MTRVLVLAYHFPPVGGGGVQRNAKFARYLPELGYELVVVTGPGGAGRWAPEDATMNDDVAADVEILRVPGPQPPPDRDRLDRLRQRLGAETAWERWWRTGAAAVGRDVKDVDLIYASLEPYWSTAFAAMELSRVLGKPWVADLQDPWALDEMRIYTSDLHRRREVKRMRKALRSADAIVMNTPEAAGRVVEAFPELREARITSITNGFDAADFERPAPPKRRDGRFRIVHTGYLHTGDGLHQHRTRWIRRLIGGAVEPRADFLTRSHVHLLAAVDRLLEAEPELADVLEVRLAGVLSDADRDVAASSPVARLAGYLPHHDTVDLMRSADLLFLPMQNLPPPCRAGIIPGKTFEFLASGTRILAAVPDGDARDLLDAAGTALLVRPADVEGMATLIRSEIDRCRRGEPSPPVRSEVLAPYERSALAQALADVFDGVLGRTRTLVAG